MQVDPWIWMAFVAFIVGMLALDLLVFHKEAHAVSTREAAIWSVVWVTLGLSFGVVVCCGRARTPVVNTSPAT